MSDDRAELYARLPVAEDLAWWWEQVEASPGRTVLYVGCGTGRLARELLPACASLVGVDRDPAMLAAFAAALAPGAPVELIEAEAAQLDLGRTFGAVLAPTSLLNELVDDDARTAAVAALAAHLAPGGRLVAQVLNPHVLSGAGGATTGLLAAPEGDVEVTIDPVADDVWAQRHRATLTYRFPDGAALVDEVDAVALFPRDLDALLASAGLTIVERWGGRPGTDEPTLDDGSWHLVARHAS